MSKIFVGTGHAVVPSSPLEHFARIRVLAFMTRDLRFALRMIYARRWFAAAIVATLALGIGLNTMVFTLINAVLFKPIDVTGGERLVVVTHTHPSRHDPRDQDGISYPDFREYQAHASLFEALEAHDNNRSSLSEPTNPPQSVVVGSVSTGIFEMLYVQPVLGRGFAAADGRAGAPAVAVIGYGLWKDRYGSSKDVLGRSVRIDGKPATIIGVMPEDFKFPNGDDLWMPIVPTPEIEKRSARNYELFGVLKRGVTIPQASAEVETSVRRMTSAYPDTNKDLAAKVQTFHDRYNGDQIRAVFFLMQGAVGFVLLIACANVANMMLSRALERRREISIRAAMGASRWQIIRQLLVECTLLSVLGGILGLALAAYGVHWFDLATQDVGKPYWVLFRMDYKVFAVFALLCIASGLIFGLLPALRASRVDLNSSLKEGARSLGGQRAGRLSTALVVFQLAATLVLLTGAAMFVRGTLDQARVNPMIPAEQLLTARVNLPATSYADAKARNIFFDQLMPRLQAIPGVTQAALISSPPGIGAWNRHVEIDGQPLLDPTKGPTASFLAASPGFFAATGLSLVSGRTFTESDGSTGQRSAVVTRAFAESFWPRQEAIGKRVRYFLNGKPQEWVTVVGVIGNFVQRSDVVGAERILMVTYRQEAFDSMAIMVRASGAASLAPAVRSAVQGIDPDLPLDQVRTLSAAVDRQIWFLKVLSTIFSTFAFVALIIASVGIYAVIAQATARRTQEIGVRMALGATSGNILTLILSRGVAQLAAGLALGLAAAIPAARLMIGLPLRVVPNDPVVFSTVSLLLLLVGVFACWLPARRAAAMQPVVALRDE
jgi:putative ABC transport system permease protein